MIISKKPPYLNSKADPEQSQMQINKLLREYGVSGTQWITMYVENRVELSFLVETELKGVKRQIGIKVTPPVFAATRRTWNPKRGIYEKVIAPNWAQSFRMMYWWLKVKLEAVAYGMTTVEQEFLSQVLLSMPDGTQRTVGVALTESIAKGQLSLESKSTSDEPRIIDIEPETQT